MNDGGWTEANVVAAAVRILGGAQKVADSLGVSRSQVYRWIKARTMAHATYFYVAKLASLSGIDPGFLGGDGSSSAPSLGKESPARPARAIKVGSSRSAGNHRTFRLRSPRLEAKGVGIRQPAAGPAKAGSQEVTDRHIGGEEVDRTDVRKGGIQQTCLIQNNGVAPGSGDHFGRRRTLRTKGQEESREHQP